MSRSDTHAIMEIIGELERRVRWRAEQSVTLVWQVEPIANGNGSESRGFRTLADDVALERGVTYFLPPHQRAWFEGRRVRVAARSSSDDHPIDHLLLSLAEGWGDESVAVVAVPLGEDGQCGLRIIRAVGGLTHQGTSAPRTNSSEAEDGARRVSSPAPGNPEGALEGEVPLARVPPEPKRGASAQARVARVLALPTPLLERVRGGCAAAARAVRDGGRERLRVWLPKCGAGGTTYATAMMLSDLVARERHPSLQMTIYGTDDEQEVLAVARAARYPASAALGLDPELRGRYTFDEGDTIRVAERLREVCIFLRHDLVRDPPLARMDVAICHRVFDSADVVGQAELVDAVHYSLRQGGLLLALDHPEVFPDNLFEPLGPGLFRARSTPAQPSIKRRFSLPAVRPAAGATSAECPAPAANAEAAKLEATLHDLGMPFIVCDAALRVSFLSRAAQQSFRLSPADTGTELVSLARRLPGGRDLVAAARRALALTVSDELSIRAARRTFLARIAPMTGVTAGGVSIAFTDVSALVEAEAQASAQRLRHAAIARISEQASSSSDLTQLYEEALAVLFGHISRCAAGLIVELTTHPGQFEVVASRGLGAEPLRTLGGVGDAGALLNAVIERGCSVSRSGLLAAWSAPGASREPQSARARQARSILQAGVACPISADGELFGVIALYGRHPTIVDPDHQHFTQAVANVLGGAIARQRTRRRMALELEVSRLIAGASDLKSMGESLQRALGSALKVDIAEIWMAADASLESWERLFPPVGGARPERPWPPNLVGPDLSGALFSAVAPDGHELLVPVQPRDLSPCLLRIKGAELRPPDREVGEGLSRIARMLGDFLERLHILDVSRRNEVSYRQKSAELEALYASLPVGVSIHDRRGGIRHVNRHLAALQAPAGAHGPAPIARLYAEEVPAWVTRVLELGEPIHDIELVVKTDDQMLTWLCNFAPIRDADAQVQGASVVVQEITALKRVEASLREADQQKDDFLAMLGHELRNPLAAIRHASELLGQIPGSTTQLARLQRIFDRQTLQTTKLIDGLLDIARVARGKVELSLAPVQVVELVGQVVDDRRQQFGERTVEVVASEDELWARADRVRLVQILDNLISNALRFTGSKGRIEIEVSRKGERGAICVRDDGAGIEAELLPKIFEPFRQGHAEKARAQGLGLGLALVKALVDLHGFLLSAHSEGPGRGASFRIDFPLVAAGESAPPPSRVDMRPLELLLVEDNSDIAETLAELLVGVGHHVEWKASAEEALEALRRYRPDVVLCDIGLPGMDGLEFAARLRADPELSALELVAMTGFGDASTQQRVQHAGFNRYLVKPVHLDALRHCLSRSAAASGPRVSRR